MEMETAWLEALVDWAQGNANVAELWLFGSRAQGRSRAESDIDLAVVLTEPASTGSTPLGNYVVLGDRWQRELETVVGRHVSLTLLSDEIRGNRIQLWKRSA